MKKKNILIAAAAAVVILIGGSFAMYSHAQNTWEASSKMPSNIVINGTNVSDMTKKQAKKTLVEKANSNGFAIKEDKKEEVILPLSGTKYKILKNLDNCVSDAGYFSYIAHLFGKEYDLTIPMTVSKTSDEFKAALNAFEDARDDGRVITKDAYVDLSNTDFTVIPEVYGTNLDRKQLKKDICAAMENREYSLSFNEEEYIEMPAITKDSKEIQEKLDYCHQYLETKITYEFGSEKVTLTPEQLDSLINVKDGTVTIKTKAAKNFIYELASKYNTYYLNRQFKSTSGRVVSLVPGTYGYIIDQEKELKHLSKDLKACKDVSREPEYSVKGNGRNGTTDILNTYVEVDLSSQHMYYYKNGSLIVDSPFVSGRTTPDEHHEVHGTICGVFTIAYKDRDATLKGGSKENGTDYESDVKYWMPFCNGIGLHDAPWRDKFGGSIYKTNGSHGCINLPESAAAKLFNNVDAGTIVVVFY